MNYEIWNYIWHCAIKFYFNNTKINVFRTTKHSVDQVLSPNIYHFSLHYTRTYFSMLKKRNSTIQTIYNIKTGEQYGDLLGWKVLSWARKKQINLKGKPRYDWWCKINWKIILTNVSALRNIVITLFFARTVK